MIEKSPDFQTKLFENPLDECEFNEYAIDTNWRTQHSSAPQWVQTLSTLSSQSQDEVPKNFLRATQISLTFAPTLQVIITIKGVEASGIESSSAMSATVYMIPAFLDI